MKKIVDLLKVFFILKLCNAMSILDLAEKCDCDYALARKKWSPENLGCLFKIPLYKDAEDLISSQDFEDVPCILLQNKKQICAENAGAKKIRCRAVPYTIVNSLKSIKEILDGIIFSKTDGSNEYQDYDKSQPSNPLEISINGATIVTSMVNYNSILNDLSEGTTTAATINRINIDDISQQKEIISENSLTAEIDETQINFVIDNKTSAKINLNSNKFTMVHILPEKVVKNIFYNKYSSRDSKLLELMLASGLTGLVTDDEIVSLLKMFTDRLGHNIEDIDLGKLGLFSAPNVLHIVTNKHHENNLELTSAEVDELKEKKAIIKSYLANILNFPKENDLPVLEVLADKSINHKRQVSARQNQNATTTASPNATTTELFPRNETVIADTPEDATTAISTTINTNNSTAASNNSSNVTLEAGNNNITTVTTEVNSNSGNLTNAFNATTLPANGTTITPTVAPNITVTLPTNTTSNTTSPPNCTTPCPSPCDHCETIILSFPTEAPYEEPPCSMVRRAWDFCVDYVVPAVVVGVAAIAAYTVFSMFL